MPLVFLLALDLRGERRSVSRAIGLGLALTATLGCSLGFALAAVLGLAAMGWIGRGLGWTAGRPRGSWALPVVFGALLPVAVCVIAIAAGRAELAGGPEPGEELARVSLQAGRPAARDPLELFRAAPLHPLRSAPVISAAISDGAWRRPLVASQIPWLALGFASALGLTLGLRARFVRRCVFVGLALGAVSWWSPGSGWLTGAGFGEPWLEVWPLATGFLYLAAAGALELVPRWGAARPLVLGAAAILLGFEGWVAPLRTFDAGPPAFVAEMTKLPTAGSWVLLPLSTAPHRAHGWQAFHGRPGWAPLPGRHAVSGYEQLGLRAPNLFRFGQPLAGGAASSSEALRLLSLSVSLELDLERIDHVLLDIEQAPWPLLASDLLDSLPGFVRAGESESVLWWARVPSLMRLEAGGSLGGDTGT